jgi:hypothetical protein
VLAVVQDETANADRRCCAGAVAPRWAKLKGRPLLFQARNDKLASSTA